MTPHLQTERAGPGWALHHATYQETLAVVAEQGGADLIAFSPPYCDARTYGAAVSWTDSDYAALGDAVFSALKPGGHALVNVDAPVREWRPGFGTERGFHPWRLMLDWAERVGFRVPDRLAFGRMGLIGQYGGRFRNDWEPLLWFQRTGAAGWFEKSHLVSMAVSGAYAVGSKGHTTHGRTTKSGVRPDGSRYSRTVSGPAAKAGERNRGTLWNYSSQGHQQTGAPDIEDQNHPARWPYRLAEDLVRCFCPPDGLVCDPFVGAGTTGAAAIAWGRRFVGGDLFARQDDGVLWVDVAAKVLTDRQRQAPLFGAR